MRTVLLAVVGCWLTISGARIAWSDDSGTDDAGLAESSIGRTVPPLSLIGVDGEEHPLAEATQGPAVVVAFMGIDCPVGNLYAPILQELYRTYSAQGVSVIGIYASAGVTIEEMQRHREQYDITFPVFHDPHQRSVAAFGATRTPETFVLDQGQVVRYQGRVDNRLGYTYKRTEAERADLELAVQEVLEGREVTVPVTETQGCLITLRDSREAQGLISFTRDISRIMQNNCQECHRPGTAAPFSLLTYDDVADQAEMIKEVVLERRMPPWHADPDFGEFSNDLRMEQSEIDQIVAWVDAGMPSGDEGDMPEPRHFAEGWMIDEPDLIFEMPETFDVPATGVVEYQYWRAPSGLEEDVWVRAAEARPGNRAVVHHIILYYLMPDAPGDRRRVAIVGTAPGEEPVILPPDMGIRIPAGAELLWEMHYTPVGREQSDRSQVGIVLCDEPPKYEVSGEMVINWEFEIPPHASNHEVVARRLIDQDVRLITFMPHMHLRGKDFLYRAIYPDSSEEILLSVPRYDFNWQHTYRLAEPKLIPAGTTIECVAHFDNSAANPANPDPDRTVTWGDQTWEEMMIGFLKYVPVEPTR